MKHNISFAKQIVPHPRLLAELSFLASQNELANRKGWKEAAATNMTNEWWDGEWEERWDESWDGGPEAAALQKGGKGKQKAKGKGKNKKGGTPPGGETCPYFLREDGCKLGGQCSDTHPRTEGRCL